jgi:DNA polymerase elongation subunit (family B)
MTADETKTLYMFDIETEGLAAIDDRVTTIGFKEFGATGGHTIYYIEEEGAEDVSNSDIEASSTVDLRPVKDEEELFVEVFNFIDNNDINNPNNSSIIGFNSDKFDVQFLRTRVLFHYLGDNVPEWIFTDVKHLDIMKAINSEFNTKALDPVNGIEELNKSELIELESYVIGDNSGYNVDPLKARLEDHKDDIDADAMNHIINKFDHIDEEDFETEYTKLEDLYDEIIPEEHYTTVEDPFDDSKEAVTEFEEGNVGNVIQHNVSDLERTDGLVWLIIKGVAGEKSKLPTVQSIRTKTL